jgi:hypothetical protein
MYVRKYLAISILGFTLVFISLCALNERRGIIRSPLGEQYITIFRPVSLFWKNELYVIPYKYEGFFAPKSNYAIIKPRGFNYLNINWRPDGHCRLKLEFSSGFTINNLDSLKFKFAREQKDFLDNGDSFSYPKYVSYTLDEIFGSKN